MIFCYIGTFDKKKNDYTDYKPCMFDSMDEFDRKTWKPIYLYSDLIDTERAPAGKTYQGKKAWLRDRAISYSNAGDNYILYDFWNEQELKDYFFRYGRKYGLIKEFKENAIC